MEKITRPNHLPLYSESQHVNMKLKVYYDVLNEQPEFLDALEQLRAELRPWLRRDDEDSSEWHGRLQLDDDATVEHRRVLLTTFAERWGLPRRRGAATERRYRLPKNTGTGDVFRCLNSTSDGQPVRLQPDSVYWRSPIVSVAPDTTLGTASGVEEYPPRIYPVHVEPFVYDPFHNTRAWVREKAARIAEEIRQSIEQQAEQLEQQFKDHGARQLGIRYQEPGVLRRMAERLYRRAVLKMPWTKIAQAERAVSSEWCDTQSVRTTVGEWANALDIQLPVIRGGRPKKTG